ncbi:hypothetical protein QE152_g30920 [Popillia japonica]|uniref:Uncharacterized protein n=1 Tax=Popillia japonica TaxID=7064 RepID=A0AAW1JDJ1_POPJA
MFMRTIESSYVAAQSDERDHIDFMVKNNVKYIFSYIELVDIIDSVIESGIICEFHWDSHRISFTFFWRPGQPVPSAAAASVPSTSGPGPSSAQTSAPPASPEERTPTGQVPPRTVPSVPDRIRLRRFYRIHRNRLVAE